MPTAPRDPPLPLTVDDNFTVGEASCDRGAPAGLPPQPPHSRYVPLRLHARGGLGEVFVAYDQECQRVVALKTLRADASTPSQERFLREAAITARLQHPGIVAVHSAGVTADGRPQYVMPLIKGETLTRAVRRFHATHGQPVPDPVSLWTWLMLAYVSDRQILLNNPDDARRKALRARSEALRRLLRHVVALCEAVDFAHRHGVIHRDLKPDNVMIGACGETLIIDWGLAKVVDGNTTDDHHPHVPPPAVVYKDPVALTQDGTVFGTPAYMSPEQAAGEQSRVGRKSDVYALGAILHFVLTNTAPYHGPLPLVLAEVRQGCVPPARSLVPWAPSGLAAVSRKAMSRDPADRHPSAGAVADDINRWLADEPLDCWREPVREWLPRLGRKYAGFSAGLAVSVSVLVMALFFLVRAAPQLANHLSKKDRPRGAVVPAPNRKPEQAPEPPRSGNPLVPQVTSVATAYHRAYRRLGRPPQGAGDLAPELPANADLQKISVAWGTDPLRGDAVPLVWCWYKLEGRLGGHRVVIFTGRPPTDYELVGPRAFSALVPGM